MLLNTLSAISIGVGLALGVVNFLKLRSADRKEALMALFQTPLCLLAVLYMFPWNSRLTYSNEYNSIGVFVGALVLLACTSCQTVLIFADRVPARPGSTFLIASIVAAVGASLVAGGVMYDISDSRPRF